MLDELLSEIDTCDAEWNKLQEEVDEERALTIASYRQQNKQSREENKAAWKLAQEKKQSERKAKGNSSVHGYNRTMIRIKVEALSVRNGAKTSSNFTASGEEDLARRFETIERTWPEENKPYEYKITTIERVRRVGS